MWLPRSREEYLWLIILAWYDIKWTIRVLFSLCVFYWSHVQDKCVEFSEKTSIPGFTLQTYEPGGESQGQGSGTPIDTWDKHAGCDLIAQQDYSCSSPLFHSERKEKQKIILSLFIRLAKPSRRLRFNIVKLFFYIPPPLLSLLLPSSSSSFFPP